MHSAPELQNIDVATWLKTKFPVLQTQDIEYLSKLSAQHKITLTDQRFEKIVDHYVKKMIVHGLFDQSKADVLAPRMVNAILLVKLFDNEFPEVQNPDLFYYMENLLAKNELWLWVYTGEHRKALVNFMKTTLQDNRFDKKLAESLKGELLKGIKDKENISRQRFNQAPVQTILQTLSSKGYVEINQEALDEEINLMLDTYMTDKGLFTHTISLTNDNGETLKSTLQERYKDKDGKLLIPVAIGNHYCLLICKKEGENVTISCWNPTRPPINREDRSGVIKNLIETKSREVWQEANIAVSYLYAGEQIDGFTCGARVIRQAFIEARVENPLVDVKCPKAVQNGSLYDNSSALSSTFIEQLAKTSDDFREDTFNVVVGPYTTTVFSNKKLASNPSLQNLVEHKKTSQESEDEKLALALQDVYRHKPNIDDDSAFRLAQQNAQTFSPSAIVQKRSELSKWIRNYEQKYIPAKASPFDSKEKNVIELDEFTPKKLVS